MTITEFLLARIAEREEAVKEALATDWMGDHPTFYEGMGAHRDDWGLWTFNVPPDHVLARCKADRAIVALHVPVDEKPDAWCTLCDRDGWPCATMSALASAFADHPDYDEAWRI